MSHHHNRHQTATATEMPVGDTQTLTATGANEPGNGSNGRGVISALKSARDLASNVQQKAVAGARATDKAVHDHPYKALGVAVGLGVLLGMLIFRRSSRRSA